MNFAPIDNLVMLAELSRDVYMHTPTTETLGIVGVEDFAGGSDYGCVYVGENKTLYVVVAGTDDSEDWKSNIKALKRGRWYGMKVHRGFARAARQLELKMLEVIEKYPDYNLIFSGHSRGGAIALLLAISAEYHHTHRKSQCVTFGQPRVSTERQIRLAYRYGEIVRVVNGSDAIPRYPKIGYSHAGTLFYIPNRGSAHKIDPGHTSRFVDRLLTFTQRVRAHSITDYIKGLRACKN